MKKYFLFLLCGLMMNVPVWAQDKAVAEKMINTTLDSVIQVLKNNDLSQDEKGVRINEIVTPMFDFKQMAKLTLGRKYWPTLNHDEQEKFTKLFVERLKESYRKKLMLYHDEQVVLDPSEQKNNKLVIPTHLVSNGSSGKVDITYKLYYGRNQWMIYDIEIQGVSIIQSYRSQFDYILKNGTVQDLLKKLEEPETEES